MASDDIKSQLSSGEVLLIDTRQHWVAAIRYAIRPILIAGLAVLLSVLNQWLQFDRLGFINDILHWIILIAFIVAIVWLPVDLFRWWSRHYVLTNRRALRLEGVLRKQSFDSSLEQINDILLSQSFLGRQLGYADLTLLTANASNEAYEQLLDGPQFKRAVLDAKEAIRSGQPLQALPEGFVVKGGTNEASVRASSKAAPVAEASTTAANPAAAAGTVAVAGTAGAAFPEEAPATAVVDETPTPAVVDEEPAPVAPIEDTGGADAPSVAAVVAEDEAFAEWPEPVQTDPSVETEIAVDAGAVEEAREVVAAEPAPTPEAAEPFEVDAAAEEPGLAEEPGVVAPDEPAMTEEAVSADTAGDTPVGADSAAATDEDHPAP